MNLILYNTFHHLEIIQRNSHQHFVLVCVEQTDEAARTRAPENFDFCYSSLWS